MWFGGLEVTGAGLPAGLGDLKVSSYLGDSMILCSETPNLPSTDATCAGHVQPGHCLTQKITEWFVLEGPLKSSNSKSPAVGRDLSTKLSCTGRDGKLDFFENLRT